MSRRGSEKGDLTYDGASVLRLSDKNNSAFRAFNREGCFCGLRALTRARGGEASPASLSLSLSHTHTHARARARARARALTRARARARSSEERAPFSPREGGTRARALSEPAPHRGAREEERGSSPAPPARPEGEARCNGSVTQSGSKGRMSF